MGFAISLNNAAAGGFVVAGGPPGVLRIRTDDGTTQAVTLRAAGPLTGTVVLSASALSVGPADAIVELRAGTASAALDDSLIEIVAGGVVVGSYAFTAITGPEIQFEGRFQCRLATDPDGFDHKWGVASSFGLYAVQGPNPAAPHEPPLDRIVRFQGPVAPRALCPVVGVTARRIRGRLAGGAVSRAGPEIRSLDSRCASGRRASSTRRTARSPRPGLSRSLTSSSTSAQPSPGRPTPATRGPTHPPRRRRTRPTPTASSAWIRSAP